MGVKGPTPSARRHRYGWARLDDEALLDLRFCDLGLVLDDSTLGARIDRLYRELAARGLSFRPHCWLAEEWFSPDGVPGFALPFYLVHPRLRRLERRMMREVEGGNLNWCMRILRHEAGHALDNAYRIRRRRAWRETFGPASRPYPDAYRPRPGSRRYVQHLGGWYAQSHPTEDFAETFAVWLAPRSQWRDVYDGWPALEKLEYVDGLMRDIAQMPQPVRTRMHVEPLSQCKKTLRQHYEERLRSYSPPTRKDEDDLLGRVFARTPGARRMRAATLLRRLRPRLHREICAAEHCGEYLVHQVMRAAILRADELNLYVAGDPRRATRHARRILTRLVRAFERSAGRRLTL